MKGRQIVQLNKRHTETEHSLQYFKHDTCIVFVVYNFRGKNFKGEPYKHFGNPKRCELS